MKQEKRQMYIDVALRINKIQINEDVLKIVIACVDIVDKSKGKATLDEVLIN